MIRMVAMIVSSLAAGAAMAQTAPPNPMGVTMGHWHLNSRDLAANKKILVDMGGVPLTSDAFEIIRFPGVYVYLNLPSAGGPPTGDTAASSINHVGLVVPNVQASIAKWKAAGVPVQPGGNNRLDQAFVVTPDGLRIEILEDKNQQVAIRHDHVHFRVPQAAIPQAMAWYAKTFGATAGAAERTSNVPGAILKFAKADTATEPTKGHVLDHIGFDITNLKAFIEKLEADGIKLDRPYRANKGGALAFIHDPWGTSIELNERPNPL